MLNDKDKINAFLKDYKIKVPKDPPRAVNVERFNEIMYAIDAIEAFILDTSPDAIFETRYDGMNPKDIYFTAITDEIIVKDTKAFFAAIMHGENFELYKDKKSNIKLSIKFGGAFSTKPPPDPFSDN